MKNKKHFLFCLACIIFSVHVLSAENFPEKKIQKIREYPKSVVARIEKHDVQKLLDDEYFLQTLAGELKDSKIKTEEKVYFFYLMLQKIRWAFCGGISMPSSMSYADYSLMQISTFFNYRSYLSSLEIDAKPFFGLALKNTDKKPILVAYSFLLGSLLEKDEQVVFQFCDEAYKNKFFEKPTLFRSMLIHNMMLVSPLMVFATKKDDPKEFSDFLILTQSIFNRDDCKEEEKEDLVISVCYDAKFASLIIHLIIDEKNSSEDFFVLTCAGLVKARTKPESFKEFIDFWESHESEDWKKELIAKIKSADYKIDYLGDSFSGGGGFIKTWDDVNLALYDNGILFEYDGYSEFLPNNR